jgi:glycosyltransferase involved in cell wall biosynthesis
MNLCAAADVYLGPSLEGAFGLPVLEAMACGLPVALVRRVVSDPVLREVLASNALRTAERCAWDGSAAALWDLLNQTLAGK